MALLLDARKSIALLTLLMALMPLRVVADSSGESALLDRLLTVEDRRLLKDKALLSALSHPSVRVRKMALTVAGRIKDLSTLDAVIAVLNKKKIERELKVAAAFALGMMGSEVAVKILQQHSQMQNDPTLLETILFAMGRSGSESTVPNLAGYLGEEFPADLVRISAQGLGLLWSGPSEKWAVPAGTIPRLVSLAGGKGPTAIAAAFALSRYKGDISTLPLPGLIDSFHRSGDDDTRAFLLRVFGRLRSAESTLLLIRETGTDGVHRSRRIEAAKALSLHPASDPGVGALAKVLAIQDSSLLVTALDTAYAWGPAAAPLTDAVEKLYRSSSSNWVKGAALRTLASIAPPLGKARALEIMNAPNSPLLEAAVFALAVEASPADLEKIVGYVNSADVRVAEAAIDGLGLYSEEKLPQSAKPALRKALVGGATGPTCLVSQLVERGKWRDFAGALATAYPLLNDVDQIEAKVAVLRALAAVGDSSHMEVIQTAISDPERLVALAAVAAKKAITGTDDGAKVPPASIVSKPPTPTWAEARAATQQRVTLVTNRGEVTLALRQEAPLTAFHFVRLVKEGFYNGKTFHRVVPNFISQGGDPLGDGYGGPGFLLRDEPSAVQHNRGTVGIATAGPDTGGCQFFVNLAPNLHLDGKYTVFADVASGMGTVDRLEVGDRITSARVVR